MRYFPSSTVMRFSLVSFIITLALGLLSMGFLGIGLYYIVSPILRLNFPPLDSLHGDWAWPALIMSGMAWSFAFPVAGWVYMHLSRFDWTRMTKVLAYIFILLLWDLILWALILGSNS